MLHIFDELTSELNKHGANFMKSVDISMLSSDQNRGYTVALLIGIVLSPYYIFGLSQQNILDKSEFAEIERNTDRLADWTSDFMMN